MVLRIGRRRITIAYRQAGAGRAVRIPFRTLQRRPYEAEGEPVLTFLVWLLLLIVAWPLAVLALILYPVIWLIGLPLRLIGISVSALLDMAGAIIGLPARILRARSSG